MNLVDIAKYDDVVDLDDALSHVYVAPMEPRDGTMTVKVAAAFDAKLSHERAEQLPRSMEDGGATRPREVALATRHVHGDYVLCCRLLEQLGSAGRVPARASTLRGTELMRRVGGEPTVTIVDVLAFG